MEHILNGTNFKWNIFYMEQILNGTYFKWNIFSNLNKFQMEQIFNETNFGQFSDLIRFLDFNRFQILTISNVNSFEFEHFRI
jgi:hypothetical protein